MKRIITILCLIASIFSLNAIEFTSVSGNNTLKYVINEDRATVSLIGLSSGTGNGELLIPSTVTHLDTVYAVTKVSRDAFKNCEGLTGSLIIPDGVLKIEEYAFSGCTGLTGGLTLSSTLEEIGIAAFYNCSTLVGDLTIPNSVKKVGSSAFRGCSGFDGKIVLSQNLTKLEMNSFRECSGLKGDLVIPGKVSNIGEQAFGVCTGLSGRLVLPNSVYQIGSAAFARCDKFDTIIVERPTPPFIDEGFGKTFEYNALNLRGTQVKVDSTKVSSFKAANGWKMFNYYNTVSVVFDGNGAVGEMDVQRITKGCTEALYLNDYFYVGNSFLGWASDSLAAEVEYADGAKYTALADDTLYAVWEIGVIKVKFHSNGGEGEMEDQEFEYDVAEPLNANIFTREDHTYLGWSRSSVGLNVDYEDGANYKALGDDILYAVWRHDSVTSVSMNNYLDIDMYPNPTENILYIEADKEISSLCIYGLQGEMIKTIKVESMQVEASLKELVYGVYILKIYMQDGTIVSRRIIKSKSQ